MQRRITTILLIATLFGLVICASVWTSASAQDSKKTIIWPLTLAKEPIEITVELKGQPVNATKAIKAEVGIRAEEFEADKDWLKNLSLKVTNKSNKAITYIVLDLTFPETAIGERPRMGLHQIFLGVDPDRTFPRSELRLAPHEVMEVPLAERYNAIKTLVELKIPIEQVTQMEIRIHDALFDDGTLFETGAYYRRNPDPNDPRKWIKIDN